MKRVLLLLCLLQVLSGYAQKVDTLYYDQSWKGVDHPSFATYYRVVVRPSSPLYPTRFKSFYMDGVLRCEGVAEIIDAYDDDKSKFKSLISYYRNGNKEFENFYENGEAHGVQIGYYESGNVAFKTEFKHGVREGYYSEYTPAGNVIVEGVVENNVYTGAVNVYSGEMLTASSFLEKGIRNGKCVFYENGNISAECIYNMGVLDGLMVRYNGNGAIVEKVNYVNGLPLGRFENREDGVISTCLLKEVWTETKLPIRMSVGFRRGSLVTSVGGSTTGAVLGGIAAAIAGVVSSGSSQSELAERRTYFDYFDLKIYNDLEGEDFACDISDVKVEYIRKTKSIEENSVLSHRAFAGIFSDYASAQEKLAEHKASSTASSAASQTSNYAQSARSYAHQDANVNVNTNASASASAAAVYGAAGATAAGAYGANTNGYAAGVYGGAASVYGAAGAAAARENYHSNTNGSASANQYGLAYGSSSSTTKDGYLEYQIYQNEMQKANSQIYRAQNAAAVYAEYADYDFFRIAPQTLETKWIGVKPEKRYDKIRLTFRVNDVFCMVEFDNVTEIMQH